MENLFFNHASRKECEYLSRFEIFNKKRLTKIRYILMTVLIVCLVFSGILIVDYSINDYLKNTKSIEILTLQITNSANTKIQVFEKKVSLNFQYVIRDYRRIKEYFTQVTKTR